MADSKKLDLESENNSESAKVADSKFSDSKSCFLESRHTAKSPTITQAALESSADSKIFYHFPRRGLHTQDILNNSYDLLLYQAADIVVIQAGVVDCSRRVMKRRYDTLLQCLLRRFYEPFQKLIRRYMYALTSLYEVRYVSPTQFEANLHKICDIIYEANKNAQILWISIAPAGSYLVRKVYGICSDIAHYNEILERVAEQRGIQILYPYGDTKADELTIHDGHHLSHLGHKLVYHCLSRALEKM